MLLLMGAIFVIGYVFIAFEHPLKIDKAASAILAGVLCWTVLALGGDSIFPGIGHEEVLHKIEHELGHHLTEIASILFFLMAAMTVVELIDGYGGFSIITGAIKTTNRVKLMWILCFVTFFLSAALDNLTTAIVMAALIRKLMKNREDRWLFAGMVVIAANAGGAWSPIGDVTTIMLWIKGQVTAGKVVTLLIIPSIIVTLVPLLILSFTLKGEVTRPVSHEKDSDGHGGHAGHGDSEEETGVSESEKKMVLILGVASLLFVPIFKNITHLPPYMGILFGLGVLWIVTEFFNAKKDAAQKLSVVKVLRKIDMPSVLFFLGILLAVGSLQTAGVLRQVAMGLDSTIGNVYVINTAIGILSAIVDNVPLVAGAQGMYDMCQYPQDHDFWLLLAFCAGTGGSSLIIGSAAGVAIMGIMKIDFMWYLKKISLLALSGYLVGVAVCYLFLGTPDGPACDKKKCDENCKPLTTASATAPAKTGDAH